jgi:hypothetical protein
VGIKLNVNRHKESPTSRSRRGGDSVSRDIYYMDAADARLSIPEALGAPGQLVTASQLAAGLGVTRAWVYEHADELGALRLGGGKRPRLRFDPQVVAEALASGTPRAGEPRQQRGRPRRFVRSDIELLPIGPDGGVPSRRGRRS